MTSHEKARMLELRNAGRSLAQIAEELRLSKNTVKSFFRRMDMKKSAVAAAPTKTNVCAHCGGPLLGSKPRRFCSDRCRYAWSYAHRILGPQNAVSKSCPCCGERFFSYASSHRKYCSRSCYHIHRTLECECNDTEAQTHADAA
jgi:endogenous inhibitor of DNA gyrase (YacG/DUF329 family)